MAKTLYVSRKDVYHMLECARVSSQFPVRNIALLLVAYGTGMKLIELATLPVSVYLAQNGVPIQESLIPASIAYNDIARPIYWTNPKVIEALDKYLEYRVTHNHGTTTKKAAYRGLDPTSTLFCTDEGFPYKLTGRKTKSGAMSYSPDSLSQLIKSLHDNSGNEGGNAESARRSFAIHMRQNGGDYRHIGEALGLQSLSSVRALVGQDPVKLGAIVQRVI